MKRAKKFHQAEMSDLDLEKAAIKHEFSSPWEDSDLVLVVEDQKLHVHRSILKVMSPVFKTMLSSEFKEKDATEVPLPGKKVNEFVDFLRQIYPHLGNQITLKNIKHIYSLADEYQMTKLMNDCRMFLSSVEKTKENAIDMLLLAQDMEAEEARQQCYYALKKMTLEELESGGLNGVGSVSFRLNAQSMKDVVHEVFFPRVKRYHECMKEALPQFLGSLDVMVHLYCEMGGFPSKCSKHSSNICSPRERIQCKTCKKMFTQVAQNVEGYNSPKSQTKLTENIAKVLEEMMFLTQERY